MKTRRGFVSNSSTSSFVIMAPEGITVCTKCGRSDPDLFETLSNLSELHANDDSETSVSSLENTIQMLVFR